MQTCKCLPHKKSNKIKVVRLFKRINELPNIFNEIDGKANY